VRKADTRDTITLDKQTWTLQQFHFHAPSENTVHGKKYAMEMHLVHKNARGELTVVAVMFDKGAANPELDKLWSVMPQQAEQNVSIKKDLNLNKLLPKVKTYWRFSGSLTTPPCSEGVTWIVLKHPDLSAEQLEKFTHTMHHDNNRPVQSLHGRRCGRITHFLRLRSCSKMRRRSQRRGKSAAKNSRLSRSSVLFRNDEKLREIVSAHKITII
jgi:carbonic anhydrase